jgi:hypothetical protein
MQDKSGGTPRRLHERPPDAAGLRGPVDALPGRSPDELARTHFRSKVAITGR